MGKNIQNSTMFLKIKAIPSGNAKLISNAEE